MEEIKKRWHNVEYRKMKRIINALKAQTEFSNIDKSVFSAFCADIGKIPFKTAISNLKDILTNAKIDISTVDFVLNQQLW